MLSAPRNQRFVSCSKLSTSPTMQPHFAELTEADTARLDKQRSLVATTLRNRYAAVLTRTKLDLPLLLKLLDDGVFTRSQTFELQSLGVVFGDVLATETGLHWMMVTDDYGTDSTLVRGASSLQVNALTVISKRVERADSICPCDRGNAQYHSGCALVITL
jgi:hypothetical protein